MTECKCDLCGELITGPASKVGVVVLDRKLRKPPPNSAEAFLEALGQHAARPEVHEYDACFECAGGLMVELERRRKQVKALGRVVTQ